VAVKEHKAPDLTIGKGRTLLHTTIITTGMPIYQFTVHLCYSWISNTSSPYSNKQTWKYFTEINVNWSRNLLRSGSGALTWWICWCNRKNCSIMVTIDHKFSFITVIEFAVFFQEPTHNSHAFFCTPDVLLIHWHLFVLTHIRRVRWGQDNSILHITGKTEDTLYLTVKDTCAI
jgi:hypothetical protein